MLGRDAVASELSSYTLLPRSDSESSIDLQMDAAPRSDSPLSPLEDDTKSPIQTTSINELPWTKLSYLARLRSRWGYIFVHVILTDLAPGPMSVIMGL